MGRRRVVASTLVVLGGVAALLPAGAVTAAPGAPPWQQVHTVDDGRVSRPDVVTDSTGADTVAWSRGTDVMVQRRTPGGTWRKAVVIGRGVSPQLAVDGAGRVTVVWTWNLAGHGPQLLGTRGRGSSWAQPTPLTPVVGNVVNAAAGAFQPDLAVDAAGDTVLTYVWNQPDSGASVVRARYRPAGSPWGAAVALSPVEAHHPSAAVDGDGRAAVAYVIGGDVSVRTRSGSSWSPAVLVAEHAEPPELAAGDDGSMTVVVSALTAGVFRPFAATRDPGGAWSSPVPLDPGAATDTGVPLVGFDQSGHATAAWTRADGRLRTAGRDAGGSWTAAEDAAAPGGDVGLARVSLSVSVGTGGDVLLAFTRAAAGGQRVSAVVGSTGSWGASRQVGAAGCTGPQGAVSPAPGVSLVWRCGSGAHASVQHRHADAD